MPFQVGNPTIDSKLSDAENNSFLTLFFGIQVSYFFAEEAGASPIGDLAFLYGWVRHNHPATVIECGVYRGASSVILAQAVKDNGFGHVWSVDHLITPEARDRCRRAELEGWVTFIEGDSKDPETPPDPPYDFVFLDSDHSYDHVLGELKLYVPRLSPGGYLFCMDGSVIPGCRKACEEFRDAHPEFLWMRNPINNGFDMFHRPFDSEGSAHVIVG